MREPLGANLKQQKQAGTEFMGAPGGHVPPQLLDRGDIISFPPKHFVIKSNVVVQILCYFTVGNVSLA